MKIEQDSTTRSYHIDIKEFYDRFPELEGIITWMSYDDDHGNHKVYISTDSKK